VGDTEVGLRFLAYGGERTILTFGLNVTLPTGSRGPGLGEGFIALEPLALVWHDFGCGNVFQGEFGLQTPLGGAVTPGGGLEAGTVLHYSLYLGHTFGATKDFSCFRWLTPSLELNGLTSLDGSAAGRTEIDVTPGLRWVVNSKNYAAVGFSFPVTGARDYDSQLILDWNHDF
jgi:hypothetical protein